MDVYQLVEENLKDVKDATERHVITSPILKLLFDGVKKSDPNIEQPVDVKLSWLGNEYVVTVTKLEAVNYSITSCGQDKEVFVNQEDVPSWYDRVLLASEILYLVDPDYHKLQELTWRLIVVKKAGLCDNDSYAKLVNELAEINNKIISKSEEQEETK